MNEDRKTEAQLAYEAYNAALHGDYNFPSPGVQWSLLSSKAKNAWATVVQHVKESKDHG